MCPNVQKRQRLDKGRDKKSWAKISEHQHDENVMQIIISALPSFRTGWYDSLYAGHEKRTDLSSKGGLHDRTAQDYQCSAAMGKKIERYPATRNMQHSTIHCTHWSPYSISQPRHPSSFYVVDCIFCETPLTLGAFCALEARSLRKNGIL